MPRILSLLAALAWGIPLCAQGSPSTTAPAYTVATIVNSATGTADALAPNTIATIYGSNLSDGPTMAAGGSNTGAPLPQELGNVHVYVAGSPVSLYYVSPQQINFLIPADLRPGEMDLFVACDGLAGPLARITLHDAGPGIFQSAPGVVSATHADGSLVTKGHPARRGETVAVYGTGFGPTTPDVAISVAAPVTDLTAFHVLVAGVAVPGVSVLYAGVVAYTPGLYQATFKLPKSVAPNPEIRIAVGEQTSPPHLKLPLQ
ncbi:MAG TPA: hypothetical protein VK335_14325 [Bryobacteraceae bacterium]|nr:hypothetical protein [Bryobacteraceae bacterium]